MSFGDEVNKAFHRGMVSRGFDKVIDEFSRKAQKAKANQQIHTQSIEETKPNLEEDELDL